MKVLVTGGAGFIGTAVVSRFLAEGADIVSVDKFTYAAAHASCNDIGVAHPRYILERADIGDRGVLQHVFAVHRPDVVVHLAGATHVDRSIDRPDEFVRDNLVGTLTLLEAARAYWHALDATTQANFRFINVSTTDVFGALRQGERAREDTPYHTASPYAASKAGADHLMEAWFKTFGLPTITTRSSNNYGPRQFPEKLIPLMILNALEGKKLPIYGTGGDAHDWIYVGDHAAALWRVLQGGRAGASYNIGAGVTCSNLDIVKTLCTHLDEMLPKSAFRPHDQLITFVRDRPGHKSWNAVDTSLITDTLGWRPIESLASGLCRTVRWYLENEAWWRPIRERVYGGERLGHPSTSP